MWGGPVLVPPLSTYRLTSIVLVSNSLTQTIEAGP